MNSSENVEWISVALVRFQADVESVAKTQEGQAGDAQVSVRESRHGDRNHQAGADGQRHGGGADVRARKGSGAR